VVIEHDMASIRNLDARTSVLHYGKLFAQGSFAEIAADADVRRIYLASYEDRRWNLTSRPDVRLRQVRIVNNVSLRAKPAEIIAVIGRNGVGQDHADQDNHWNSAADGRHNRVRGHRNHPAERDRARPARHRHMCRRGVASSLG